MTDTTTPVVTPEPTPVVSADIWFKSKRVLRTVVQVVLGAAGVLATVALVAPQVLTAIADVVPGPVLAWLVGAVAFLAAISAAVTRVMAIPAVNLWLANFGVASAPAAKLKE